MKKRIILLCDGTWNNLEMRYITNVGWLAQLLPARGKSNETSIPQLIYYDTGVAADDQGFERLWNGAFGGGLDQNIYQAYCFLAINYEPGDEVCMYGFSRGAYTVRSLAGMIERVGLVPKTKMRHFADAMGAYRDPKKRAKFLKEVAAPFIHIDLLGCWDTVGAMGVPDKIPFVPIDNWLRKRHEFRNTTLGKLVKTALHAVAIDEHRKEFDATLMQPSGGPGTTLKQVWFPGDHGSVGGGSWEKRGLSTRCLRWMIDESKAAGIDLGISTAALRQKKVEDHSISLANLVRPPFRRANRSLKGVSFADIDETAKRRFLESPDPAARSIPLQQHFARELSTLKLPNLRPSTPATQLNPGQGTWVHVDSRKKSASSGIRVRKGQTYRIEVGAAQVWKDGDLDPCDVLGWSLDPKANKLPWIDGRQDDLGFLKAGVIRKAERKRLVRDADWFELVVGFDGRKFHRLNLKRGAGEIDPITAEIAIPQDGELHFAANDLASVIDLIDKYDNNSGGIWVSVTRTA